MPRPPPRPGRRRALGLALALACIAAALGADPEGAGNGAPIAGAAAPAPLPLITTPFSPDPGGLEPVEDDQEPRPLEAGPATPGAPASSLAGAVAEGAQAAAASAGANKEAASAAAEQREERGEAGEREREAGKKAIPGGAPPPALGEEAEREREEEEAREAGRGDQPAAALERAREQEEAREEAEERALEAKLASGAPITASEFAAEAAREREERRERQTRAERAADDAAREVEAGRLSRFYARLGLPASSPRPTAAQLDAEAAAANPGAFAAERRAEAREREGKQKGGSGSGGGGGGPSHSYQLPRASAGAPAPTTTPAAGGGAPAKPAPPPPPAATAPINPAFPSPVGRAFPAPPGAPPAPRGLSLSADLPPLYEPSAGGRGLAPDALDSAARGPTSFASIARRVARDAYWLNADPARLDDAQAAANEKPEPRRGGSLAARVSARSGGGPNPFGARPDDVPTAASPAKVAAAGPGVSAASPLAASRTLLPARPTPDSPISLSFAANAAVDQPVRRFRPPDQALCVGAGHVVVGTNALFRSFNAETGAPEEGPISVPDFFNLTGNFSDPGCIYDGAGSKRFFLSFFRFNERSPAKFSHFVLAVSATSNPGDGFIGPYIFPNDGLDAAGQPLPGLEACAASTDRDTGVAYEGGCLGDYPSVGLDGHALWAGFNLFSTEPREAYAGVLVLAISKAGLVSGASATPSYAAYSNWDPELAYTVQPTVTQAGSAHDGREGGTTYLTSTGPVSQNEPNQPLLAVWAATHTDRVAHPSFPKAGLPVISNAALLDVPAYADPGILDADRFCMPQPDPGVPLDAGDARTLQSVWSGGLIWTAAQTVIRPGPAAPKAVGAVWWAVRPGWGRAGGAAPGGPRAPSPAASPSSLFTPALNATGYVAVPGHHASRPAITASPSGAQAWIGGTLVGDDLPPSPFVAQVHVGGALLTRPAGTAPLTAAAHVTTIHLPAIAPDVLSPGIPDRAWDRADPDLGGTLRSGDYSAATLDEAGHAWLASQWSGSVPSPVCVAKFAPIKCPNWGTYVTRVDTDAVKGGVDGVAAAARAVPPARAGLGAFSGLGGGQPAAEPGLDAAVPAAAKPGPGKAPAAGGDASGGALAAAADASRKKTKAGGSGAPLGPKRRGEEGGDEGAADAAAAMPAVDDGDAAAPAPVPAPGA